MLNFVVFAEAASDAEIVCGLANRVFDEIGRITVESLPVRRSWIGYEEKTQFTSKDRISSLFDALRKGSRRPRNLGYIQGEPQKRHAAFWRKAIQLVVELRKSQSVAGVMIHHDMDHEPKERRKGLEQVRNNAIKNSTLKIVLALPDREIEAWILNGFLPENPTEVKEHAKWKRRLKFDPCTQAERATVGDRDPKKILNSLTAGSDDRKRQCWEKTELTTLKLNGDKTNLTAFLKQVEAEFLGLFAN